MMELGFNKHVFGMICLASFPNGIVTGLSGFWIQTSFARRPPKDSSLPGYGRGSEDDAEGMEADDLTDTDWWQDDGIWHHPWGPPAEAWLPEGAC